MSREWQEGDVATGLHHGDWVTLIRSARPAPRGKWLRLDNLGFVLDEAVTDVRPGLALRHIARTNPRREAEYQATLNDRADMWAGRPQDQRPEDRA